jgi:signal transduction histidine kinase
VRVAPYGARDDADLMDPESSPDPAGVDSTDSASTSDANEVVPAGAEALFPSVPIEALPPPAPIDQVLSQPIPAEALSGADPAEILSASLDFDPATEVPVPSLRHVVAAADRPDTIAAVLPGGGEMGARIRTFDWSRSVIGSITNWPGSLQSAVGTMLASGFPTIVAWGPDAIQLYNDACIPMLGPVKHMAALGQRAAQCWPEIWTTLLSPAFQQVLATGEPFRSEDRLLILNRHGFLEETYFTLSFSAIRGDSGRPEGVLLTSIDMTDRTLAERRLRTRHELASHGALSDTVDATCRIIGGTLRANPNDLPFALLYFVSNDGRRAELCTTSHLEAGTTASPETIDLSSLTERDVVWPIARVLQTDRSELVGGLSASGFPGGPWPESAASALVLPIRNVGSERYPTGALVAGLSPRLRFDGAYRGFLDGIAAHISTALSNARAHEIGRRRADALVHELARRRLEDQARADDETAAARPTLEEPVQARDMFFAAVAHELRGPINVVQLGLLSILREADRTGETLPTPWVRDRASRAAAQTSRLIGLIDNLLEASRIESGRLNLQLESIDLMSVATEVLDRLDAAEQAQITRRLQPTIGRWDRLRLDQILTNLVSNAVKYGEGRPIDVAVRNEETHALLEVSDHGIGIPIEHQSRIFERFERVAGDRRRYSGFGLGLWITSRIVAEFGGSLAVRSEPGAGSTFTVRLPKQPQPRAL